VRDKRSLLWALVPAALGGIAAVLLSSGWLPDPPQRLVVFGDRAGLLLGAGVFLSVVLGLVLLSLWLGGVRGWR
jgi:hypothetical protein